MYLPPLSLVLVGMKDEPHHDPTAVSVNDVLIPNALGGFTLAELGAFRALATEVIRAVDEVAGSPEGGDT